MFRSAYTAVLLCVCLAAAAPVVVGLSISQQPQIQPEGGTIKGSIVGTGDRPVAGVRVLISGSGYSESLLTSGTGQFEAHVPKTGSYVIRYDAPGFRPGRGFARIDLPGQTITPIFRMSPSSLRVRVFSQGGENKGLAGVSIVVTPRDGGESVQGTTDGAGEYYFGALRAGTYTIKATLLGYEPLTREVYIVSASETVGYSLALSKGSSVPIAKAKQTYTTPRLPSDEVRCVYQDSSGYMWFGTDRGAAKFDGANFEGSNTQQSPLAALADSDIRCITELGNEVYFGTDTGLLQFDGTRLRVINIFSGQAVNAVKVDDGGVVWVATATGLYRQSNGEYAPVVAGNFTALVRDVVDGGLWAVGANDNTIHRIANGLLVEAPIRLGEILGDRTITTVYRTSSGILIVGTDVGAFSLLVEGASGGMHVEGDLGNRFLPDALQGSVSSVVEDFRGNLWFGTSNGVVLYNKRRLATEDLFVGEKIYGLFIDREGNLWFATEQGAIRKDLYSFVPFSTSDGLINTSVSWVYPDPARSSDSNPIVWFVTSGGVQWYDGSAFNVFDKIDSGERINHLMRDRNGQMWFATSAGVYVETATAMTRVSETPANWLAETSDGAIWAATEQGIELFNGKGFDRVEELARYNATRLFPIFQDLWIATDEGAARFNIQRRSIEAVDFSRGIQGEAVRWIAADKMGHIWLATDFGAELIDAVSLKKLDGNGGVNSGGDERTLLLDGDGFMWVGSASGSVRKIAFYDGGVLETTFTAEQGISGLIVNAIAEDTDGGLWFATDGGAMQHLPIRTLPSVVPRVEVDGRPVAEGSMVPAGSHTVRFLFHGITMIGDVRYLYRLDGEGPWEQLPARQELTRDVSFVDLASGAHTFELRALNRDLYGINAPPVKMGVRIDVYVWKKWWFYGVGLMSLAGFGVAAGFFYRYKTREYVLPPELKHYVPIEPNPFIVGNPIRNEDMFFGREDDFRYVRTKLEGAAQGSVIVLCGDRRTGKSSILYQILNGRLGNRFIPVFVDLQEMVVSNDREFFRRVGRLIADEIELDRDELKKHGFFDEDQNPYHQFSDFLDLALDRIGDRALVLLIDEYELLESKVEEGRLDAEIFLFLAGLMDSKERLSFIFTGSRRLEERDRRYWREMLRRSLFRKIGFLSENDARRLITEPVAGRVVFGRGVIERIARLTAGQPFYTQVICQNIVDYLNEHERNALAARDFDAVVKEIVDHPLPQMIYFWEGLSADEKVVLSLLSHSLEPLGDRAWATAADIVALIRKEKAPVDLSENTIHLTLEELFRTEVLEKNPFEAYRFRIDLLRLWVRRSHSIWQVLKGT